MKHTNHINTISVSDSAFDWFIEEAAWKARNYNTLHRLGAEKQAEEFYQSFWGMMNALHALSIGYNVEYTEDLEYLTDFRIWCGKLEKHVKLM